MHYILSMNINSFGKAVYMKIMVDKLDEDDVEKTNKEKRKRYHGPSKIVKKCLRLKVR